MSFQKSAFHYKYTPILSISPAEMSAIEELPEKDKDLILPVFSLRGWVGSQKLESTIKRIKKSIGSRVWVANVDETFFTENADYLLTGKYPREVFHQLKRLVVPDNGYNNWFEFLTENEKAIPTLLWGDIRELETQIHLLTSLNRGLVIIVTAKTNPFEVKEVFRVLSLNKMNNVFIMLDLGQIDSHHLAQYPSIANQLQNLSASLPEALFSISASSFPSSFSGYNRGEIPIYERLLFNKVREKCNDLRLVYSDRGSARSEKISGGGGIPAPRIDYPLKNDWRFIREEFSDSKEPKDGEKESLYSS
ncbi:hypothetical protein, partial [uncultured Rheinheimera sp.]|uniref:beta family protein n=1 Tax=uncultured Rheinheimera sp. TaxID=400532 RepID=UPI0025942526